MDDKYDWERDLEAFDRQFDAEQEEEEVRLSERRQIRAAEGVEIGLDAALFLLFFGH